MDVKSFLVGLMTFVLFTSLLLGVTFELYGEDNLDVNMTEDANLQALGDLQDKVDVSKAQLQSYNEKIEQKTMSNLSFKSTVTNTDLLRSAWDAFTNIPSYIGSFFTLMTSMLSIVSVSVVNNVLWYFIGIVVVTIGILIINAILGSNL